MKIDVNKIKDFIEQNVKDFGSIIQPGKHITDGEFFDLPYIVGYLQGRIRAALFFYLNGSYWLEGNFRKTDLIYPFCWRLEPSVINIFLGLRLVLNKASLKFGIFENFSYRLNRLNKLNKYYVSNNEISNIFSAFYREFEHIASKLDTLDTVEILEKKGNGILEENNYPLGDQQYLAPLFELQKFSERYFKNLLKGFYLHGSLSTMDYIPHWSDVDTFMIVSKETITSPEHLNELRKRTIQSHKYLYQIDPHQLHGHLLISEFDLDYYPQSYFPLILFDYSKSFFTENITIKFVLRNDESERLASFWNDAVYYFMVKAIQHKKGKSKLMLSNERKLFFHRLLTFPLFYLQAKGIHIYKKYSFNKAQPDFLDRDWEIIREVTSVMKNWGYYYKSNRYLKTIGNLNPKLYLLLINKYYDIKYLFIDGVFKDFQKHYGKWLLSALELSITGWNTVLQSKKHI